MRYLIILAILAGCAHRDVDRDLYLECKDCTLLYKIDKDDKQIKGLVQ